LRKSRPSIGPGFSSIGNNSIGGNFIGNNFIGNNFIGRDFIGNNSARRSATVHRAAERQDCT
jgi:hypothetical protein